MKTAKVLINLLAGMLVGFGSGIIFLKQLLVVPPVVGGLLLLCGFIISIGLIAKNEDYDPRSDD